MSSKRCGRQGISLRGHRDDWKHVTDEETLETFCLYFNSAYKVVTPFQLSIFSPLISIAMHYTYTSKTTQNEIIDICGNIIRETILEDICGARYFSIMVDKATDAANDEQLTVSLRTPEYW